VWRVGGCGGGGGEGGVGGGNCIWGMIDIRCIRIDEQMVDTT